jgi:AAT family amino acid transporter
VFIRTVITIAAAILLYIFYYKTSHDFLGTQKGFMHEQQFPMIPTIWLINIWLVHHWFMDNWPAWKMVPKTAEEIAADHAAEKAYVEDVRWTPALGWGLGAGALCGLGVYFITLNVLPWAYRSITVIK